MNLVYKHENSLKVVSLVISVIAYLALLVVTKGLALLYLPFIGLFYLFAQSGLIAHLRGTGVRVSEQQYPDIHAQLVAGCKTLEIEKVPECYVLRTSTFNAFATRFLGRSFVVLFTDVLDALRDHPEALAFYLGHELGHLKRRHLQWHPLLLPPSILPLLGAGYRRAQEYTCDRHGLACSPTPAAAQTGLVALATSGSRLASTSVPALIAQTELTGGFWMSFHELIGDYPWLSKRLAELTAAAEDREAGHPRRSFFAWVIACFVPRLGIAGAPSGFVMIAMIGILAAIAIPAYQDYTIREQVTEGLNLSAQYKAAIASAGGTNAEAYSALDNEAIHLGKGVSARYVEAITVESGAVVIHYGRGAYPALAGQQLVLVPALDESGRLAWICGRGREPAGFHALIEEYEKYSSVPDKYLPSACRGS